MDENTPASILPIDYIQPNPLQPRGVITPESLSELVDSIRTHGIIQPLIIAHTPAGYQIIAGERRWRASKLAGLKEVPVRIVETSPQGMLEMAIVENVQRTDLNPIDRANSFERLINEFGLGNSDICARIGKSPAFVSNTMRLLELPDALKDGLISGIISEGHARALAAIPDTQAMIEAYKIILREGGSVRRAEDLARRFKKGILFRNVDTSSSKVPFENIDTMAKEIQKIIGDNSRIKFRRSRIETAISIVLKGTPEQTEGQIQKIYESLMSNNNQSGNIAPTTEPATPVSQSYPENIAPAPSLDSISEQPVAEIEETEEIVVTNTDSSGPRAYFDPFEPLTPLGSSPATDAQKDPDSNDFSDY